MAKHTPDMSTARAEWVSPSLQRMRNTGYYVDPELAISQVTRDRQDANAARIAADILGTVTADEAFAANELTEAQAWDYVTSQPCLAHLTVPRVLGNDRLRVLAARHAMKVMQ